MKNEKLFEVILAPTDMLEKELENVLGGDCPRNICGINYGACSINDCETNTDNCGHNTCVINIVCLPGYTWNGCRCVPVDDFE